MPDIDYKRTRQVGAFRRHLVTTSELLAKLERAHNDYLLTDDEVCAKVKVFTDELNTQLVNIKDNWDVEKENYDA